MKATFLGTSAGFPTPERNVPALLLECEGEYLLFDCGEGTQRQMMLAGMSLCRKMKIFITHMHGDHLFGLPGMIQTMNLLNRPHKLEVYGPPGIGGFIMEAASSTLSEPSFELSVNEVHEGEIARGKGYRVLGVWADHSIPDMAFKVIFGRGVGKFDVRKAERLGVPEGPIRGELKSGREGTLADGRVIRPEMVLGKPSVERSLVYTGDTRPTQSVERFAAGTDLLVHEATFSEDLVERAIGVGHSTAIGAAEIAKRARAKRLILTHVSARYPDARLLVDEARTVFPNADLAEDFASYELKT
ncbi:MAG: ribonuclease Z [Candidatus Methanomethylicia archaeon]|nr:ribonuclease Z [Candidatus Methanomethylicia archaeon]